MWIPLIFLFMVLGVGLLAAAASRRSRVLFAVLAGLLWLPALGSAFFVGWAWLERAYSENWAMYGLLFISLPAIGATSVLTIATIAAARLRLAGRFARLELALYLLLLFLLAQVGFGIWAWR